MEAQPGPNTSPSLGGTFDNPQPASGPSTSPRASGIFTADDLASGVPDSVFQFCQTWLQKTEKSDMDDQVLFLRLLWIIFERGLELSKLPKTIIIARDTFVENVMKQDSERDIFFKLIDEVVTKKLWLNLLKDDDGMFYLW
jgi:hypothetical protein